MARLKAVFLSVLIQLIGLSFAIGQSTVLSWPLSTNFTSVTYNTNDLNNGAYVRGSGVTEDAVQADGGHWYNFTANSSLDANDYLQIALSPKTGTNAKDISLTSIEFNIKQAIWSGTYPGPSNYELYYSKNSDFSDAVLLDADDLNTSFLVGDVNFTSPISVFSGESIYFRIYAFGGHVWGDLVIEDNQFVIKGNVQTASTVNPVPSFSFIQECSNDAYLLFDLPSGFNASNETLLIFAKANSAINVGTPSSLLSSYNSADNNLTTFSGSVYENDGNARLVYRGTAAGPQALTALTSNTNYHFIAFNVSNPGGSNNFSAANYTNGSVSGVVQDVEDYTAIGLNQMVSLAFTSPSCLDQVMIVAKDGVISGSPSGNGSAYTADSDYLGTGTSFNGGKVVYKANHASGSNGNVDVTNLTNDTQYHFKAFVRKGTQWSSGIEITATPNMAAIVFTQVQANGSDFFEFITLERQDLSIYNITDQGVCESGAIYRSFSEWESEGFFSSSNGDIPTSLVDVPAGTFVKVYSGNTTVDIDYSDGLIALRNSNLNLSSSGDQVLVYTDPIPGPFSDCSTSANPIEAGIDFASTSGWITSGTPDDNTSYEPSTTAAYETLKSQGKSRVRNSNFSGDSAAILNRYLSASNWQQQNNNNDYWRLKKILFNQSDYSSESMTINSITDNSFVIDASTLSFLNTTRSTRYIVVVNEASNPNIPVDRYTCYTASSDYSVTDDVIRGVNINYNSGGPCGTSQTVGNGKVVYFDYDLPSALSITGLSGCTNYRIAIHAVNGNGATANFGTSTLGEINTSISGSPSELYYSQSSGNFSANIWDNVPSGSGGALPTLTTCLKLVVQNGHTVTMDGDYSFGELEVEAGGTLILGTSTTSLQRDLTIDGSLTANTGKFIFNGSDGQQIINTASEIVFYDVEVDKSSMSASNELLIASDNAVSHLLTIANGDISIQAGSSLRLISDAADYAAALGPVPSSSTVAGEFIIERFLPAVSTEAPPNSGFGVGWRYVGSPVQGATLDQFTDDGFTITGVDGAPPYENWISNGYYFPSLQFYDESVAGNQSLGFDGDALTAPNVRRKPNVTDAITPGKGVFWYLGPVPNTFDSKGTPIHGTQVADVDYTSTSGGALEDGWNLMANPYPCAIDWKLVSRSAGVGNFAYIYDATGSGNYVVLDASASGEKLIASSNAFWVKTSADGTLTFEESDKSLDVTAPFYKNADEAFNELYVSILSTDDSTLNDFTRLRFMEEATAEYDVLFDAPKRFSLNPSVPGITTMIDSNDFAINSFNPSDEIISIPLKANIRTSGNYEFSFDMAGDYFDAMCLVLHDKLNDEMYVIEQDGLYSFASEVNEVADSARFELIFRPTANVETVNPTCFGAENGELIVNAFGDGPFMYSVFDANGIEVSSEVGDNDYTIDGLAYGFYSVEVDGLEGECASVMQAFFIGQPAASEQHELEAYKTECKGGSDGEIQVNLSDSLIYTLNLYKEEEFIESISNGVGMVFFSNREEGEYRVDVVNSCDSNSYFTTITSIDTMQLDFEFLSDTIYLQDGGEVICQNLSSYASTYNWIFEDAQEAPYTEENGSYIYSEAGSYEVYLIGKTNSGCERFISKTLEVIDLSTGVDEFNSTQYTSQIRYVNGGVELHYSSFPESNTQLKIVNELGQVLYKNELNSTSGIYLIPRDLPAGMYYIQIEGRDGFTDVQRVVIQ